MTPAETCAALVEAMARRLAREHHVAKSFADIVERHKYVEATWRRYESECSQVLSALSAKLRELGLKIVPVEATEEMMDIGHRAASKVRPSGISGQTIDAVIRAKCNREAASYRAMVAAAPDVLGGGDAD